MAHIPHKNLQYLPYLLSTKLMNRLKLRWETAALRCTSCQCFCLWKAANILGECSIRSKILEFANFFLINYSWDFLKFFLIFGSLKFPPKSGIMLLHVVHKLNVMRRTTKLLPTVQLDCCGWTTPAAFLSSHLWCNYLTFLYSVIWEKWTTAFKPSLFQGSVYCFSAPPSAPH